MLRGVKRTHSNFLVFEFFIPHIGGEERALLENLRNFSISRTYWGKSNWQRSIPSRNRIVLGLFSAVDVLTVMLSILRWFFEFPFDGIFSLTKSG